MSVLLFSTDRTRLIAHGTLKLLDGSYRAARIPKTKCVIEVNKVVVPGAILKIGSQRQSLSDFEAIPFDLLCLHSHLQVSSISDHPPIPATPPTAPPQQAPMEVETLLEGQEPDTGFGQLILEEFNSATSHNPASLQNYVADPESKHQGDIVLNEVIHWAVWNAYIRSQVSKDTFHVFNMFHISVVHRLQVEFARALRDAIFIPDPADKAKIISWGARQEPRLTWEAIIRKSPQWLSQRCKRIIPPPEELYPLVSNVFRTLVH
ncbi:hypothetical protein MSAN_02119300 [Mycena sanguinolenta]|uniref:Uncharacterized protein n=1 Tax=Mycena sanguinolenta TaxID=230812 RepID=A0A8H6XGU6_9AGAR|nr:hypothetical protein MSAN_02119300 [Mycena sanguinolenta]